MLAILLSSLSLKCHPTDHGPLEGYFQLRSPRGVSSRSSGAPPAYVMTHRSCVCTSLIATSVLPAYNADETQPSESSKEIAKVALRLKYQIEQVVSCEVEESALTNPNSRIITSNVINTAHNAGGEDHKASVVFCLLVCLRWFRIQSNVELWDSDLHAVRAVACEVIAKRMYGSSPGDLERAPLLTCRVALNPSRIRTICSSTFC